MWNDLLNSIETWSRAKRDSNGGFYDKEKVDRAEENFQKAFDRAVEDRVRELINEGELKVSI